MNTVVIIGGGQAGYQTAASLRQQGFTGKVTVVNNEPGLPYQRPPLSKGYLLGTLSAQHLLHRNEKWYASQDVEVLQGHAESIDREGRRVLLEDGTVLEYDHLVLATGARNRELPVAGAELAGVFGMKTQADADAVSERVRAAKNVVVIGAGFIGLEFASVAAKLGANVHVLELADRPMARALSVTTSQRFREAHEGWGVTLDFGSGLDHIEGENGEVRRVITSDGRALDADLVVYGIGVIPNTELAEAAGLEVSNGIVVDALLQTSDPNISAVGDAVNFPCMQLDHTPTRLESVQNAADQARALAAHLMGKSASYTALPWFWSDQGDLKLQIAGMSNGYDTIIELEVAEEKQMVVLCFKGDVLIAVETVNRPGEHMIARRILADAPALTPEVASAPGFNLKEWEQSRAAVAVG
jgi:NADPH-dependent 2,4-dienoyl-CoA reductase/sulfur reductase-like enzyme